MKKLTAERIIELKNAIAEDQAEFSKLSEEIAFLQSPNMDEIRIREMWNELEQEKIQKEREKVRYDQWLKERDEKKLQIERQWRPNYVLNKSPSVLKAQKSTADESETEVQQQAGTTTATTPSPLLTSLLKSSQANQPPIQTSNSARSAPTITNLLTGSSASSSSSNSPLITQSPSNAQNLINASVSVVLPAINHSASCSQIPVSQSAPTLITLLDKKATAVQDPSITEKQQLMMSISVPEGSGGKDDVKDEEADILADFNALIAEKFDDEELEDINSIIMNTEILEEKLPEDEPMKDVDDSSQATSTDDYDKLKIKQLVDDFAGVAEVEQSPAAPEDTSEQLTAPTSIADSEIIQVPSEPENSNPASVEMIEPAESNDSKEEAPVQEDKVMIISDESSNTNDGKKESEGKVDAGEGEESQSVKSSVADDVKDEDSGKEIRAFRDIQESDDNSGSSDKDSKKPEVYHVDDSDDDGAFVDAKEHQDDGKSEKEADSGKKDLEKTDETQSSKPSVSEVEEVSRSAGSVDSDDEVLEVKVSRSTGRKKALENVKADTPKTSTRSRDHSENDETKDSALIRTRSRRSSIVPNIPSTPDTKPTYNFPKEQDHSMWKARWEDCQKEIQKLKDYSSVVDNKIFQEESFKSVVLCSMTMKQIQKNIESLASTLPGDVKRDFSLMCTNITMNSRRGSKFYDLVHQFMLDGMQIIDKHLEVADAYKSYRKQIKKKN